MPSRHPLHSLRFYFALQKPYQPFPFDSVAWLCASLSLRV